MVGRVNPNSELEQSIVSVPDLAQVPEEFVSMALQFPGGHDDVHLRDPGGQDED